MSDAHFSESILKFMVSESPTQIKKLDYFSFGYPFWLNKTFFLVQQFLVKQFLVQQQKINRMFFIDFFLFFFTLIRQDALFMPSNLLLVRIRHLG